MNPILAEIIDTTAPKFNTNVADGTAKEILKVIPDFLNEIFQSSIKSLIPGVGLTYEGYRRLTPKEEFSKMLLNNNSKTKYDLAESDLYMVEYIFKYENNIISRPIYLPFCKDGNIIKISSTPYTVVPVLSDTVISPSYKEVFARLLKDKLTFQGELKNFIVNNERVLGQVIHTKIIKTTPHTDKIGKPVTPVSLYLLGKYGFRECLRRYCKIHEFVVTDQNVDNLRDTHNVFESTRMKPKGLLEMGYIGHGLKICIPKKYKMTQFLENFLFGIIYSFDVLPKTADSFLIAINGRTIGERDYPPNLNDEIYEHWRMLLGRLAYKDCYSPHRISTDVRELYNTLEGYIDNLIKTKLRESGINITTFFDLLVAIMERFNMWLLNSKEYNSDIANRYIDVLYYLLYDIIVGFNRMILGINKSASKKRISINEINTLSKQEFDLVA